jgi:predicted homoserine dehydrogenase-like protein
MIIVDNALAARERAGNPIRVGIFGAGFMAKGFVNQVAHSVPGMRVVAICNRTPEKAQDAFDYADVKDSIVVDSLAGMEASIAAGTPAVTDDPTLLTRSEQIDCLVDMTGAVDYGAAIALDAFAHGKHLVLMNAEVDATLGPLLKRKADAAGVIVTACDGDQPGVQLNLWRFVRGLGLTPRVLGNIKGLQDPYRTPTTQKGFAEKWGQNPTMVTSFADGSKVNFEQAIVANATGFKVAKRGMYQFDHLGHVDELVTRYDLDELRELGGIVEYVVGSKPGPGVFCLAEHTDPKQQHYLNLYKLGEGPLYSFYQPYHLCHFEVHNTIARAVLFGDACGVPAGWSSIEVVAIAKRDLVAGEVFDGYGEYMTYGEAENSDIVQRDGLLPQGLVEGCLLKRDLPKDSVVTWADVDAPASSLGHDLYREQQQAALADTAS